jgi:hypothetical protein
MKNFFFQTFLFTSFSLATLTGAVAQDDAAIANKEASISFKVKPNKLDQDGSEIKITQSDAKKAWNTARGFFKKAKTEQTAPTAAAQPVRTPEDTEFTTRISDPTPSKPVKVRPSPTAMDSYAGEWIMKITVKEEYTNGGQRVEAPGSYEIGVNLRIEGSRLIGEYTWAKGVCGIATMEGEMTGDNTFEAVITYAGGCCGGAKMKFTGTFLSAKAISGKFKPDGLPGSSCKTWWATVAGERE